MYLFLLVYFYNWSLIYDVILFVLCLFVVRNDYCCYFYLVILKFGDYRYILVYFDFNIFVEYLILIWCYYLFKFLLLELNLCKIYVIFKDNV